MRKRLSYTALFLLMIGLAGCATFNANLTDDVRYLAALEWYNDNLETYLSHYNAQPPEVQTKWESNYHPIFKAGDAVLTSWKDSGLKSDELLWQETKRQILAVLLTLNLVEIK